MKIVETDDVQPTKEEWEAQYGPVPMTVAAHGPESPKTHGEAQFFHDGFLSGATAYAAAVGHSTLKSDNPKLCEVFDAQGWRTIETFENFGKRCPVCEYGVKLQPGFYE